MLDQVLMNLAVNARDAMPGGGPLLIQTSEKIMDGDWARLHPGAAPGRYVCLAVSDTGTGIPKEIIPAAFPSPSSLPRNPARAPALVLATVFGIVKQHGGFIEVDSEAD